MSVTSQWKFLNRATVSATASIKAGACRGLRTLRGGVKVDQTYKQLVDYRHSPGPVVPSNGPGECEEDTSMLTTRPSLPTGIAIPLALVAFLRFAAPTSRGP